MLAWLLVLHEKINTFAYLMLQINAGPVRVYFIKYICKPVTETNNYA